MIEIGGYFGFEQFLGREYYSDLIALNSARNALLYLLRARGIRKLYIPYYLCDSVSMICDRYGYSYEYYSIMSDFLPQLESRPTKDEYVYIVNFYGQIADDQIKIYQKKYGNIIVDNVHAFFQKPLQNIDTIYSCRKFFGVSDGSYLSTTVNYPDEIPIDSSKDRMEHILGRYEIKASDYYASFQKNERIIDEMALAKMSPITHNILSGIDYEFVRIKRNENYEALNAFLGQKNRLRLTRPEGPYAYPYYVLNGTQLKKSLAKKRIYVPTLWPNVMHADTFFEKEYAQNILPLPCDQRYGVDDMERIIEEITRLGE